MDADRLDPDLSEALARGREPRKMWPVLTEIDDGNPPKLREVASFGFWAAVVVLLAVAVARC